MNAKKTAKASHGFGNSLSRKSFFLMASAHPVSDKVDKAKTRNLDFFINESLPKLKYEKN